MTGEEREKREDGRIPRGVLVERERERGREPASDRGTYRGSEERISN